MWKTNFRTNFEKALFGGGGWENHLENLDLGSGSKISFSEIRLCVGKV